MFIYPSLIVILRWCSKEYLSDDFNTPAVINRIINLINTDTFEVSDYYEIKRFFNRVNLNYISSAVNTNISVDILAKFRDDVRKLAKDKNMTGIFKLCDELRDKTLFENNIELEDTPEGYKWRPL